jgi:peptidyl-prolyl cis-trans isomerase C
MRYTLVAGLCALMQLSEISAQPTSHAMRPTSTSTTARPTGKPVARVNGTVLTDRDLLREMFAIFPYAKQHNGGFPKAMEANIRSGAMKMMEFEELVYQEAQRRKMTVPSAKMGRALADFRKQFPTDQAFQEFLKTDLNGSLDVLRTKVERSLLIDQVLKTEVNDKADISAVQLKQYYDKNPDRFKTPESLTFQTISILAPDKATPAQLKDVRKRAEDALRKAKATKNYEEFGLLAEKISEDDYRVVMGDHKAVERAKLPPEVLAATGAMKEGQTSELIQIGQSLCVLRLNAHTAAGKQSFETVKKSLREELERSKTESLRSGLDKKLRVGAKIEEL